MSKRNPNTDHLWQKARQAKLHYTDTIWFEPRPVGKDMLERFMKLSLSKSVTLEGNYTNHSIRATVISTLDNEGFEACHIMSLSSHKSEATIKEYATKCPETKHKQMFNSLSNALLPSSKQQKLQLAAPSATVSKNHDSQNSDSNLAIADIKDNLPKFDLLPIDDFDTIDDHILANLVYDENLLPQDTNTNTNANNNNAVAVGANVNNPPPQTINTQVNSITNNANIPNLPRLPQMVFNNLSVTINYNYNFSK